MVLVRCDGCGEWARGGVWEKRGHWERARRDGTWIPFLVSIVVVFINL